jgi:hypothetical protein
VKGAVRETLVADLFRPLLPTDFGVATGIIISAENQQSAQQDIVVFDRRVLPPLLFEGGPTLIPVESALATIEVKSCLNATELKAAQENARTVRNLTMLSGARDDRGTFIDPRIISDIGETLLAATHHQHSVPTSLLFALDSDLSPTGKTEITRHTECCSDDPNLLRGMCVVGRGFWGPTQRVVFDRPTGKYLTFNSEPLRTEWSTIAIADAEHAEVLAVIESIHHLVLRVAMGRGQPSLGGYLR